MKNGFLWLDYHMVTTASKMLILLFSCSVMSNSLLPHGLLHVRFPCPSPSPGVCSNSHPLCWWWHPTPSCSVALFFSCFQSFPASGSFPRSWLFASGGQSIGVSVSASVLPREYSGLMSFRVERFDLLTVQGTLKSLLQHRSSKVSVLWRSVFMVYLSHPYMTTGKTIALTMQTLLAKWCLMYLHFSF